MKTSYNTFLFLLFIIPSFISCKENESSQKALIEKEVNERLAQIEKRRQDSILLKEEQEKKVQELRRIEQERLENERMNSFQGKYIFKDCYRRKTFSSQYTYGQEVYDGYEIWDTEVIVDNNKVSIKQVNYREYDRKDNLIKHEDVAYSSEILGEVVPLSDGVFRINGKSRTSRFYLQVQN